MRRCHIFSLFNLSDHTGTEAQIPDFNSFVQMALENMCDYKGKGKREVSTFWWNTRLQTNQWEKERNAGLFYPKHLRENRDELHWTVKQTGCISEILSHRRWPVVTTEPMKTATQWPLLCSPCAQLLLRTCTHPALPAPALPAPLRLLNKSLVFFKADNQKPFQAARGCFLTGVTFYILTGSDSDSYHTHNFPQASIKSMVLFQLLTSGSSLWL